MNLKYKKVSLFEISYKKKITFSQHSNLLRCTCSVCLLLDLDLVIWQTLLSKATYNWGIHKAIHLEEAIRQRKCS